MRHTIYAKNYLLD